MITQEHFGANVILTRDGLADGDPFHATANEIGFHNFRYPGGGITEDQTWENGGLEKIFAPLSDTEDDTSILSLREFLSYADEQGASVSIVVPSFQFYDLAHNEFDEVGFELYVRELETILHEYPEVSVKSLEIGNEYWGSLNWGAFSPAQYGDLVNYEIPVLDAMIGRLASEITDWSPPVIGVQAGAQWRAEQLDDGSWEATGARESSEILSQISNENISKIGGVVQHSYPDAAAIDQKVEWALDAMNVFADHEHISDDLVFLLSEFNVGSNTAVGVEQGYAWVESFSQFVDGGITSIDHWGITYDWLSNKMYDSRFPEGESNNGNIVAIATPAGQVYDIAENYLIGMTPIEEVENDFLELLDTSLSVTSFASSQQSVTFLFNGTDQAESIDLTSGSDGQHLVVHKIMPADSPISTWYDEALVEPVADGAIADARGDMNVVSGDAAMSQYTIDPDEMLVVFSSDNAANLVIEGAHHETDPRTNAVDDLIVGGGGNDIIRGHVGDDTLDGGGGRNVLTGGRGDDILISSDNGDILIADEGNDTVAGGDGNDVVVYAGGDGTVQVSGGLGSDLFLIGDGAGVYVTDLSPDDSIGFWGAFGDRDELLSASRADGDDLVVDLPSGGQAVFAGEADNLDRFTSQVIDFRSQEEILEITEGYLNGLTDLQLEEIFDTRAFEKTGESELAYLDTIDAVMARVEWEEHYPERDGVEPGTNGGEDDNGDDAVPEFDDEGEDGQVPPGTEDDTSDEPEDNSADPALSSGAACFVATAVYGDRLHPDVVTLRDFRDHHLKRFVAGRCFIRFYWVVGPKLARHVSSKDRVAAGVRTVLHVLAHALRRIVDKT
ncbi:calcium-binding protein [Paracoccus sp. 1_MG-2023]|uniref:calcium-binding protein n=1 Tax=Paracoccus sp. 1_MG-2023 TaxID=3062651 RepID=UPI0020919803|nr:MULTISPECIES: calcium-binding protein [unclassified Paracoccus (in: a-proteobacteria)]MDO6670362.1 calcium-binding protein [Paracoccus sp. 1_MG-2023]